MKTSKALAIILGGYLAIAPFLQNALSADPFEKQAIEQKIDQTQPLPGDKKDKEEEDKFAGYPKHIKTNYYSILQNVQETATDYAGRARQISSSFENSVKKYGIRRIVDIRNKAYTEVLSNVVDDKMITRRSPWSLA